MNNWYQVKARLERTQENGTLKSVSENYLVQTSSFGMAERTIQEEVGRSTTGELDIVAVARKNYSEIITNESKKDSVLEPEKWFRCKLNFVVLDEKNGREKKAARKRPQDSSL